MKIQDILTESQQLTEKPMGFLKKAGLGIASKFSSTAAGKLDSGERANHLKKEYKKWLGGSGEKESVDSLINFLNLAGYPTDSAARILKVGSEVDDNKQQPPAADAQQPPAADAQQPPAADAQQPPAADAQQKSALPKRAAQPKQKAVNVKAAQPKVKPKAQPIVAGFDIDNFNKLEEKISDSLIDQAITAAVQDAVKQGTIKTDKRGQSYMDGVGKKGKKGKKKKNQGQISTDQQQDVEPDQDDEVEEPVQSTAQTAGGQTSMKEIRASIAQMTPTQKKQIADHLSKTLAQPESNV
jgi:hypothetical protein